MPFKTFEEYAKAEGYCCPLHLLAARVNWLTSALAEDSGISPRAVNFWRLDYKRGKVQCKNAAGCMIIRALAILESQEPQTTLAPPDRANDNASAAADPAR